MSMVKLYLPDESAVLLRREDNSIRGSNRPGHSPQLHATSQHNKMLPAGHL